MRFAYFLSSVLVRTIVVYQRDLQSCETTSTMCGVTATVYWMEWGPRWFAWKLESEDSVERFERGHLANLLACGKRLGCYPRSYPTRSLALKRTSLQELQRGLKGSASFSIPQEKYQYRRTGVCISLAFFLRITIRIYIMYLGRVLYIPKFVW